MFDIDHAFEVLRRTAQSAGDFKTRYSLVFDPEVREIYVALERDYDHIWKISLDARTIETFAGFDKDVILALDEAGIVGPVLQTYAASKPPRIPILPLLFLGGLLAIAAAILLLRAP